MKIHPWMEKDLVVIPVEQVVVSERCRHWKEKAASSKFKSLTPGASLVAGCWTARYLSWISKY